MLFRSLLLSNDKHERLRPETLRLGEDLALYCDVGDGSMVARFDRFATTQLENVIFEDEQGVYLDLAGRRVRPKVVADPLVPFAAGASH